MATYRFAVSSAVCAGEWAAVLQPFVDRAAAIAIHVGKVDTSAKFPLGNAAPEGEAGVPYVLLIEGTDRDHVVHRAVEPVLAAIRGRFDLGGSLDGETYDLALTVVTDDLADREARRQQPRPDLRKGGQAPFSLKGA
jgi:hypothetical protein